MYSIMPNVARGTHAFRPSNQSQGPVHSLANTQAANDNSNDTISDISGMELPPLSSPPATSPPVKIGSKRSEGNLSKRPCSECQRDKSITTLPQKASTKGVPGFQKRHGVDIFF